MSIKKWIKSMIYLLKEEKKIPIPTQVNTTELLEGKVALITGGTGGIGEAIAENFIQNGCKVIIAGTNERKIKNICERLGEEYIKGIQLNVIDVESMPKKIAEAVLLFPEKKIDILVNSAGLINHTDFQNMTEQEYDAIMDVNMKGTYFMCQAMSRYMIDNKIKGHILNVSSSSSLRPAWTPYQLSKWALKGFTLGLADILIPYGIVVNAIAPGPVATQMLGKTTGDNISMINSPSGRFAMPNEIANLATYMVSDFGDLIVGDTFYITGGCGTIRHHY
jgi:3-oxoacyl-[acyl-carrier protein] reductase